ncbi:hypothetical protein EW146_g2307 [Bondarzewia mesenterica]|uniref:Major facilitator superfamily (MFS) profile domain-containing protein n=1 Tax=Bondarzewia mesenterica TaxID=1095465 RepID=A0A4S4M790_9AGAM|nr:hypothetical protein EW146_g2307 [Bondarzewia mesenterica]
MTSSANPPPTRIFGSAQGLDDDLMNPAPSARPGRFSLSRASLASRWMHSTDEETATTPVSERAPIPSALQQPGEAYTTPLPKLSMVVLSISLLGEFLTANVSMPFLLFMVEGFGELHDEADVGFWTGIIVASFFLTQFLTSLLWATVADRHGQRLVLFISLIGSSLTCAIFGTATSLRQAIVIRLLQGIFAGAIGVARGCVTVITDPSNEGRAYAILGFCWGFGGVAGAIVGGAFESPAQKWPGVFSSVPLFTTYPYLLPCVIASFVTLIGALLSLFLGHDGGPREGGIQLPPEKVDDHPTIPEEVSEPPSPLSSPRQSFYGSLRQKMSHKVSGYFAKRVQDAHAAESVPSPAVPLSTAVPGRRFSRLSRANGSAYGYGGGAARVQNVRSRLASGASIRKGSMSSSVMRRRGNTAPDGLPRSVAEGGELNFAQRLLMANENAVTNIADLWVAAAMNVDNEEVFESDTELESAGEEDVAVFDLEEDGEDDELNVLDTPTRRGRVSHPAMLTPHRTSLASHRPSQSVARNIGSPRRPSASISFRPQSGMTRRMSSFGIRSPSRASDAFAERRFSTVPSIFAHPGVKTPAAVLDAQKLLSLPGDTEVDAFNGLLERRGAEGEQVEEKPPSLYSQLPILIITQYGLLALHSTTHDMVFLTYLVSKYESGGLNLNAGHFSQLTALMCLAQIAYQFYLYPNIGPPRGRFSHLAMFRLGSLLFIPAYLTVILYRAFASAEDDGNFILMAALALSTAVRYCGTTFAYTAVSILLNYMSPPPVVGLANGIAQSIVSLARCFGPILGGWLWSVSVEDDSSGYYLGFFACGAFCALAVLHSLLIR